MLLNDSKNDELIRRDFQSFKNCPTMDLVPLWKSKWTNGGQKGNVSSSTSGITSTHPTG
jgi:hypothetical protein